MLEYFSEYLLEKFYVVFGKRDLLEDLSKL